MTVDINSLSNAGVIVGAGAPYRTQGASGREPVAGEAGAATSEAGVAANVKESAAAAADVARAQQQQAAQQREAVQESVDKLNEFIRPYVTSLQFSIDKDAGKLVVKILDTETREVIKQFPSEKVLALAKALAEAMKKPEGLLLEQDA